MTLNCSHDIKYPCAIGTTWLLEAETAQLVQAVHSDQPSLSVSFAICSTSKTAIKAAGQTLFFPGPSTNKCLPQGGKGQPPAEHLPAAGKGLYGRPLAQNTYRLALQAELLP